MRPRILSLPIPAIPPATCLLREADAEPDRTLGVLVDLVVCFDALLERYDWRDDAFCAQTARREPAQRHLHQPLQRPCRGVAQRQALYAGGDELLAVDVEFVAQSESGGVPTVIGDHADRSPEPRGANGVVQRRNAPGSLDRHIDAALAELRRHLPVPAEHTLTIRRLDFRPPGTRDAPDGHPDIAAVGERVERRVGAKSLRYIPPCLDRIYAYDLVCPCEAGHLDGHQADRPETEDDDLIPQSDRSVSHGQRHDRGIQTHHPLRFEAFGHGIHSFLINSVRLADRKVPEHPIPDYETRHLGSDLGDDADRHVTEREVTWPLVRRVRYHASPLGVVSHPRRRLVPIPDHLRPMLGRGELGADTDLTQPQLRLLVLPHCRLPRLQGYQFVGHRYEPPRLRT